MKFIIKVSMVVLISSCFISMVHIKGSLAQQGAIRDSSRYEDKTRPENNSWDPEIIIVRDLTKIKLPNITIKPGTTVVWLNNSNNLIEILFPDKKVTLVCAGAVNFVQDSDGTFISNRIPVGATASLCFIQRAEFDYLVSNVSRSLPADKERKMYKGKIIVK
jgi:hypothetical protein